MKPRSTFLLLSFAISPFFLAAQNVGIGTTSPIGKLHIAGTEDTTQLVIQAFTTQSASKPLVKFLAADGSSLLNMHAFNDNIFLGKNNGFSTSTGYKNILIGTNAGAGITTGYLNYLIGDEAGKTISSGYENIGIGQQVMKQVTSGTYNVCIGSKVLANGLSSTTSNNTGIGSYALYTAGGNNNTAVGTYSMANCSVAASNNVAVGNYSLYGLYSPNSGSSNTAVGIYSMYVNTSGSNNAAVGSYSLFYNSTGGYNAGLGVQSLYYNTSGNYNVGMGYNSLFNNNVGSFNTAAGSFSMGSNTSGVANVALGYNAMPGSTSGSYNTAVGYNALRTLNAQYNTAVGYGAGDSYNNGYNNVFVGANADVNGADYYNVIAIGQGTIVGGASIARFGNSATGAYQGYANWTNISDGRFKTDVQENVPGLDFITKLRPVTYHLQAKALDDFQHQGIHKEMSKESQAVMNNAMAEKEKITYTGFIAQEVEAAARDSRYDFSGVDKPKSATDVYGLRYAEFVVPLVKAIQEQQDIIARQKHKIEDLLQMVDDLKKDILLMTKPTR
jgi:hypothetical protein